MGKSKWNSCLASLKTDIFIFGPGTEKRTLHPYVTSHCKGQIQIRFSIPKILFFTLRCISISNCFQQFQFVFLHSPVRFHACIHY